jgi:hypothetical protein
MKKLIFISLSLASYACFAMKVDISDIDKKVLLQALYTNAKPLGMGILSYIPNHVLPDQEMESILAKGHIDYLHGRLMKINISKDSVDTSLYNEDNGKYAAERVIANLRKSKL